MNHFSSNADGLSLSLPPAPGSTPLWEGAEWSVVVGHKGRQKRFTQALPYARVGSHPGCEVVLDNPRLPPVAYLLVAFAGHVEAWPVAPIAMPRWGVLPEGEEFPVGTFRISVELDSPAERDNAQNPQNAPSPQNAPGERYPELGVVVDDRRWAAKLHRRVTIVGDDHPSVKRLRDVGLQACHGAFVAVGKQLWYLPLSPQDAPYLTGRSVAVELRDGEHVQTGRVRFLRLPGPRAGGEGKDQVERAVKVDKPGENAPLVDAKPVSQVEPVAAGKPPQEDALRQDGGAPQGQRSDAPSRTVPSEAVDSLMQGFVMPAFHCSSGPPPAQPREVCPDGFTNQVTDRMVQLGRRRVIKARLLLGTAVTLAVGGSGVVLLKIWNALSSG